MMMLTLQNLAAFELMTEPVLAAGERDATSGAFATRPPIGCSPDGLPACRMRWVHRAGVRSARTIADREAIAASVHPDWLTSLAAVFAFMLTADADHSARLRHFVLSGS
jgi:hypothetical protein